MRKYHLFADPENLRTLGKNLRNILCFKFQFGDLIVNVLLMSLRARFSHVNKGVVVGRGVGKQQRGRGQGWTDRYELPNIVSEMLHLLYIHPNTHVVELRKMFWVFRI